MIPKPCKKALLSDLPRITIGDRVVALGRMIHDLAFPLARALPHTIFAVLVAVVMTMLIASIPIVGPLLGTVAGPLLLAWGLGGSAGAAQASSRGVGEGLGAARIRFSRPIVTRAMPSANDPPDDEQV